MAAATAASAWAVPAKRGYVKMTGPDGQIIEVQKIGDEFGHHYVDRAGRTLIDEADRLVFATEAEISSRIETRNARFEARNTRRSAMRRVPGNIGTYPGTTFPAKGEQKALVILVEYKDVAFSVGNDAKAKQYFTDMLNKDNFSEYGATGCVRQYFRECSMGQFECQFDVYGPVTLSQRRSYYGGNSGGTDKAPEQMVVEACRALDSQIDFRQYDRDGDGYVDNVYVIYAGQGEASYGSSETVWPHSWNLSSAGIDLKLDGVTIDLYGCSNEWEYDKPDGMGTFTHEFSHILGLPDLYHTTSTVYYTPGEWSVLDYGPYNNDGRTPPAYSAFERNALGWINLTELTSTDDVKVIDDLLTTNTAFCLTNPDNSKEFYLFETRNQSGWDKYLPGQGMLIWHVDYDSQTWDNNSVNNSKGHQGVDLIEADGVAVKQSRTAGDCFPGTARVTSYAPKWWNGKSAGLVLTGITRSGTQTTFSTSGNSGGTNPDPVVPGEYITCADLISLAPQTAVAATLRGYIVGYANNAWSAKGVIFKSDGCTVESNIVLADSPLESDYKNCVPVQLVNNTQTRSDLNLKAHPEVLGSYVDIVGKAQPYFSVPGLKGASAYKFIDSTSLSEVEDVAPDAGCWYDLQGRPVTNPGRGLYIRNGRKYLLR